MFYSKPWLDALIVLLVVVLFFGPKRLPSLGKSLGEGMREFKDSITGKSGSEDDDDERPAVTEASSESAPPPPPVAQTPPASPEAAAPQPPPVASSERRS